MARDIELLTPSEAVKRITHHLGSDFQARQVIADALHAGTVRAVCRRVLEFDDVDPTDDWAILAAKAVLMDSDVELDAECWRVSYCWPEETRYWDWDKGNFFINASEDPELVFSGMMLEGTAFYPEEINALVGRTDRRGAGGPKPDRERWALFWISFIYDYAPDRDWSVFETPQQLKQAMIRSGAALDDPFSDNNINFAVKLAWEHLVVRQARENRGS